MKKLSLLIFFFALTIQTAKAIDYTSAATGNWNVAANWSPAGIPGAGDNVTVTTHTITLTQNETCNNITLNGTSGTRLAMVTYTLTATGTLSGSTSSPSITLISNTTGRLTFTGVSRALFAASPLWGGNTQTWRCEIALDAGATGTSSTAVKMGDLIVTSGTFDAGSDIRIDKGADNNGTISVAAGAKILARGWCGSRTGTASTFCASVTIDGELEMRGNNLNGNTVTINGILRRSSSTLALGSNPSGITASDFVYGSSGEIIYEAGTATGTFQMGLEVDRNNSATLTTTPNKVTVNVGSSNRLSVNNKSMTCGTLDLQSGIIYTGTSGRLAATTFTGGNSTNFVCTCTTSGLASTTAIPLTLLNVGSTEVVYHVGPLPTAYNPAKITNNGTVDNIGVRVQTTLTGPTGTTYVNREWNITEAVAGGTTADITLQWVLGEESTGFDRANSYISHNAGLSGWKNLSAPTAAGGSDPYMQTIMGHTGGFSPFAVGSSGALPIQLLSFTGKAIEKSNVLNWQTSLEQNVSKIWIERSSNQQDWKQIGGVSPQGSHSIYQFVDLAPLAVGYYRLKVLDVDGSTQYSHSIVISRKGMGVVVAASYPNPVQHALMLQLDAAAETAILVQVFDVQGRMVVQQSAQLTEGSNTFPVDLSQLAAGNYALKITGQEVERQLIRVVKE
jgi:Secretion system C-terminal sorting domain